jgi:4-hydroxybenzoate polyprenyltransferase
MLAPFVGIFSGSLIAMGIDHDYSKLGIGILAGLTGALLNAASNAINQYYDLEIDKINKPDRPIASGRITSADSMKFAWIIYVICFGLGYLTSYMVNPAVPTYFVVVLITTLFTWGYSAPPVRFKNHGLFANIAMAVPRGFLMIVGGWVAIRPEEWASSTPWLIGLVIFLYVLGAASTKDFADAKGDEAGGARTVVVVYGFRKAAWIVATFLVIPYLAIPLIVALSGGAVKSQAVWLGLLFIWGTYTAWLILRDPDSLALEGNHPSWKHMYMLMMFTQIGFAVVYALP